MSKELLQFFFKNKLIMMEKNRDYMIKIKEVINKKKLKSYYKIYNYHYHIFLVILYI